MARITYEDDTLTEYDDGTEEVRFTADEWAAMNTDPAFGYICRRGHRFPIGHDGNPTGHCPTCEAISDDPESFHWIRCGHCGGSHESVALVRWCASLHHLWASHPAWQEA
jgi:hypothetical protein